MNGEENGGLIPQESLTSQFVEERDLPFNMEAEQAVLGSALKDSSSVGDAAELLNPDDFYFTGNKFIFDAVMQLFNENAAIDFVTVSNRLKLNGKLEAAGGVDYLKKLIAAVPTTQHVKYYSEIIKEKSVLRSLIRGADSISKMAYDENDSISRLLERSEQVIFDISASRDQNDLMSIGDILPLSYDTLAKNAENTGGITGLDTGFVDLNKRCGGFHGGELIIIAGRPGMGKSTFAVNIAEYMSIKNGKTVAIFNLEMPKEQIVNRILCAQAMVNNARIRTGMMEMDDWEKICDVADTIAKAPIYIDDSASITVSQIRAKCRRLKQTKGLAMVVIDYLQLMQGSGRSENRQQEISEISRSLKVLAKELDIPVVALSQLKRESESQKGKKPILSDLRESGAIEQDADMVMFLFRNYYYSKEPEEKEKAECIIAKNRNGETDSFDLGFKGEYTKFINIEYRSEQEAAG
ncbi:MAG TPA: replicative DNA helicase [Candidatus Ornithomonoglobus merdipullorum]|uniref:Replicative DNA helicase n=1 Tax=Candidatus Ornithomonoglobus merdipullorum TaxID=2840895 RepID=A0A9D1MBG3_9FIRM|nr:replicative DNA helicase [Candidatus Ornithomonoglobus merdipullorum]